jgi:hypothetical protein
VHRPVGEKLEDRGTHVTAPAAPAATRSAATSSARSAGTETGTAWAETTGTEAEAATRAEAAGTEGRSESEAAGVAAAVFADVVAEVATGLPALFVLDAAVSGTESESWTAQERAAELTLVGSFIEWGVHVLSFFRLETPKCVSDTLTIYRKLSRCNY